MKNIFKIVKDTAISLRAKSNDVPLDKLNDAVDLVNQMHDYLVMSQDEEISQKFLKDEDYHVEIVFVLDEINNAYLLVFWRAVISSGGSLNFPLIFTRYSSDEYVFALPEGSGFSKIWFEKLIPL